MKPVSREGYKFRQDISIPCYQTDSKLQLRPAAFMDLAQEIAYWAAQELGFGYDTLHIHHTAWVLSRMHIHFVQPALWREQVSIYTWHKGSAGLFYMRDFDLRNEAGEHSPKVALPKDSEAECVATHRVAFSDVDLIGHTNNARYVVWAMDCLPLSQTEQPLKDLYINFNKETKADELVQLYRLQDGASWYVEGRVDGKSCFVVKLEY